jgi:hypothetical protein
MLLGDPALSAPRSKNQREGRHVPVARRLAMVSDFVRAADNLWDVGKRVALMVRRGARDETHYSQLMASLGSGPADIWEQYVDYKLGALIAATPDAIVSAATKEELTPGSTPRAPDVAGEDLELSQLLYPYSRQLVEDLETLISWKRILPSRHFACLLDSLLRLHAFTEVHHLAKANVVVLGLLQKARAGTAITPASVRDALDRSAVGRVSAGTDLLRLMQDTSWQLERSRLFFDECRINTELTSVDSIAVWCEQIRTNRDGDFNDAYARFLARSDSGALDQAVEASSARDSFEEFFRYIVSQRVTTTGTDGQFDQGYWAKKQGAYKSAKWLMCISPVGAMLFAGLAAGASQSCSFRQMDEKFRASGYDLTLHARGELFAVLKGLGLAVDNPDGDGGFLIRNPFYVSE